MKIQLRQPIPGVGQAGDICDVADAYARNFLLPRRMAVVATTAMVSQVKRQQATTAARRAAEREEWQAARQRLAGAVIEISESASSAGKLFAAVKGERVIEEIGKQYHLRIGGVHCQPDHFKQLGSFAAKLIWPDHQSIEVTVHLRHG